MESAAKYPDKHLMDKRWRVTLISSSTLLSGDEIEVNTQFDRKNEFLLNNSYPDVCHLSWPVLRMLTLKAKKENNDLMILCSTDHRFSNNYTADYLRMCIAEAEKKGADVLLGAVNWFESAIQIDHHIFWLDKFSGIQFIILFRKFYDTLVGIDNEGIGLEPEYLLSSATANKFLMYPFISGVTAKVARPCALSEENIFYADPADQLELLRRVKTYYSSRKDPVKYGV